jgi:hypothetical protein
MCFVWISKQTAIVSLYSINLLLFITEADSVYFAVQTGSLNERDKVSSLNGLIFKYIVFTNSTSTRVHLQGT